MKTDKFFETVRTDQEKKKALEAEISGLTRREAELTAEMGRAADSGAVDLYLEKSKEKERVSAAIFVKRSFMDKGTSSVSEEMAREAWKEYRSDYEKKLSKRVADFAALKEKLCKTYSEMIDLQRDACSVRERLGEAVGAAASSFDMETIQFRSGVDVRGALKIGGFSGIDPDACYYLSDHCEKAGVSLVNTAPGGNYDPELLRVQTIVMGQKSH